MGGEASRHDAENDEALFYAAAHGDEEEVVRLVDEAANVNHRMREQDGATPLMAACQEGAVACVRIILSSPTCDWAITDSWGMSATHYAARWGRSDCMAALIEAGVSIGDRAKDGATAAHFAAEHGHHDLLECLLAAGADLEARTTAGQTVTEVAAISGSETCLNLLHNVTQLQLLSTERQVLPGVDNNAAR